MPSLNWMDTKNENGKVVKSTAVYNAYETPAGPAKARAEVFDYIGCRYETWIEDPWLESNGIRKYYAKFAYGSESTIEKAKEACEDYGYSCAMSGIGFFDIKELYIQAFEKMAIRYVESRGLDIVEIVGRSDNFTIQFMVLEGGYEPARVEVRMDVDTLEFEMGYK